MSDKFKGEHHNGSVGSYDGAQPKKRGCAGHCKKFWWIYLIALVVIVLAVILPIIFVAVPKIAQQKIDAAELILEGITVTNTKSNSYTMHINSTIKTDGSVHATVRPFDGVMYLEDKEGHTPFVTVNFPETDSSAEQQVNIAQDVQIADMAAFTSFNTWLLANETLRVTVSGDTHVRVSGISREYPVHFQKTITMNGLKGFDGTTVSNPNISISGFDDGTNFHGTTSIPNRSRVTFEIGNATFTNFLLGDDVGTVFIDDMILAPGINNFSMRANISQIPVLTVKDEHPYCENGVLPFELRGKTVINHGQTLSYFQDALAASNQTVPIDLKGALTDLGLPPTCDEDTE